MFCHAAGLFALRCLADTFSDRPVYPYKKIAETLQRFPAERTGAGRSPFAAVR